MNARQAIRTRYHGPSNVKGSRISAKCEAGTIFVEYDDGLSSEENHDAACAKMMAKLGWKRARVSGVFDGDYYHVEDEGRLEALRGIVNSMRKSTWSGSPWAHAEFKQCVAVIGSAFGIHADALNTPTTDDEIATYLKEQA